MNYWLILIYFEILNAYLTNRMQIWPSEKKNIDEVLVMPSKLDLISQHTSNWSQNKELWVQRILILHVMMFNLSETNLYLMWPRNQQLVLYCISVKSLRHICFLFIQHYLSYLKENFRYFVLDNKRQKKSMMFNFLIK